MDKKYFKWKLNKVLDDSLQVRGEFVEIDYDIFDVDLVYGFYEIVWSECWDNDKNIMIYKVKSLILINDDNYYIKNGKILIGDRLLYTSQFVHFDLSENRNTKLDYIFKEKV
jgi:hypothetical protein